MNHYGTVCGYRLIPNPSLPVSKPKQQLSDDCPVTDEFRAEFNLWMTEFFGTERVVFVNAAEQIIYANPVVLGQIAIELKQAMPHRQSHPFEGVY